LRVSLRSPGDFRSASREAASQPPPPLLHPLGPAVILGDAVAPDGVIQEPLRAGRNTLFGPRGACLLGREGPLWVADTGHHRLLGWSARPTRDGAPADWVIGQPDFASEGRNARGAPTLATLNVPTGITPCGAGLAVADAWNHRVLIWRRAPCDNNVPADLVLGQRNGSTVEPNQGRRRAGADTLHWPYGLTWDGVRLFVSDAKNRRVLIWNGVPEENGQPADSVLGQLDFECSDENAGSDASAMSMRWPHQLAKVGRGLAVADAGNNRVMIWRRPPRERGARCDLILGQRHPGGVDHNQSSYWPNASSLNMPYGVVATDSLLLVADTANSRLLAWELTSLGDGVPASRLSGQAHFCAKGDNAWAPASRSSLCWPYGVAVAGEVAVVADSGNNRVQLWNLS
jgi:hypothetical protein